MRANQQPRHDWTWELKKTVKLLEEAGHQQVQHEQRPAIINRNLLVGPFSYRSSGSNWELLNGDGRVFSWLSVERPCPSTSFSF